MKSYYCIPLFVLFLSYISCKKEDLKSPAVPNNGYTFTGQNNSFSSGTPCGTADTINLYAGQNILAGNVTIYNDSTALYIDMQTIDGWEMAKTHLYVGNIAGLPINNAGNPQIGQFPYVTTHNPMITNYSWSFPLSSLDSCFIIALHAELHLVDSNGIIIQSETGWADGDLINQMGNWATYYSYCAQSCCEIVADTFQIFGGQTIPVGNLVVNNDDDFLYVSWNLTGCWELEETHLYVGLASGLPVNNANVPIPGQFPYSNNHSTGVQKFSYTIPLAGLPPCIVIAAHAAIVNPCTNTSETAWSDGTPFPDTNRWGWYSNYCLQFCP